MISVSVFFMATLAKAALACTVRTPPFDPTDFKSGVIIEGVIQSSPREGRTINVSINVERVVEGQFDGVEYAFSFFPSDVGGNCVPASTQILPVGQRLVVYLERRDAGLWPKGWMHFEDAMEQDDRVRVASTHVR